MQQAIHALHPGHCLCGIASFRILILGFALLYGELARFLPTPVVELNRAVAVAMAFGLDEGLRLVAGLESAGQLAGYHLLPATKADLFRRLGRAAEAAACYREALDLAGTDAERRFLRRRLTEVDSGVETGAG